MGVEREETSGALKKFVCVFKEVREPGNYRLFPLKSIIKNRLNVKLHLSLYLPYSITQFSSYIRKIFYLYLHHQKKAFNYLLQKLS